MDFPRGKLPPGSGSNKRKRHVAFDVLFKKSDPSNDDKKKSKRRKKKPEGSDEVEDKVVIEAVSVKRLPIGTTIIGCINDVTDCEITMIVAGGASVSVPIYNISDTYSALVEEFVDDPTAVTPFKPQSMFEVGQCLPVKILEKNEDGKRRNTKIVGTINPKNVYSEVHPLSLKSFASSIVISAAVTSVEDHGYIMDIGMDQMSGFLSAADAKDYLKRHPHMSRIPMGCVLLCSGVSLSSRVLKLTTKKEQFNSNIVTGDSEVLPITSVVPGLKVSVRIMDVSDRGLEIMVTNEHKGYVHRDHLKSEWDVPDKNYSIAQILEARVLFVHPISQIVVCTLRELPDPAVIEKKFASLSSGKLIPNAKVALYDERSNMILMTKDDKIKLLASKNNISDEPLDESKMIQQYPVGSKQICKVLSISYFDQLVRVTLKPSYVNEECIGAEDVLVGTILTGKVKNLSKNGLYLKIGPRLVGFARDVHFADAPKVIHPEKMFPLDKEVKCRVLSVDTNAKPAKIMVTCKKSLVSNKPKILDTIEKATPGFETLGVVVLANKSGVLLEFFGGLNGWISRILLTDYADIGTAFQVGQIVKCYVISSDPKTGRISLSLNKSMPKEAIQEETEVVRQKPPQKKNENPLELGNIVHGKITKISEVGLDLELTNDVTVTVPLTQIIDSQYINKRELERRFELNDEVTCRVLERSHGEISITMKPLLLNPTIETWKNYSTINVGMKSLGFISKILVNRGRFITFVGGVKGWLKESLVKNNSHGYKAGRLQPGELVACQVIDVDPVNKKLAVDLYPMDSFVTNIVAPEKPVTSGFSFDNHAEPVEKEAEDEVPNTEDTSLIEQDIVKNLKTLRSKESEIRKKEARFANKELKPETEEEHERRVVSEPNSCIGWLEYMSYLLECNQIDKARHVGERALKSINYREEEERFNIWVALINLEHFYGDQESLKKVIERALQVNDAMKVDLRVAKMYQEGNETELAEQVYESMMKKFKHDKTYWIEYGMFNMKLKRFETARNLMKKSLDSLPNRDHLDVISKFAQMEFRQGQIEQGKSLFENILVNYPKRIDVWIVYVSMLIKYAITKELPSSDELESVRRVFERILSLGLNAKKVASIFKKYLEFEEMYGNSTTVQSVKDKSVMYVEANKLQSAFRE